MPRADASSHLDDDFCTDLLFGLVSRADADLAMDHLAGCARCEEMFRRHVAALEHTRAGAARRRDGRRVIETGNVRRRQRSTFPWLSPKRLVAGALAAVAVVAALIMIPLRPPLPPPEFRLSSREILETRSASPSVDRRLWEGISAYEAKEYERAVWKLRQAGLEGPHDDLRMIYIASALTLLGDYPMAVDVFRMLDVESLPEPSRSEAKWIKYIALYGDRRTEEAEALLERLSRLQNDIGELARERKRLLE